jgi:hypothetical protein
MLLDSSLCIQDVEQYEVSLTKVVGMTWMQKISGFSQHVVYLSVFFTHPIGMKWYKPSMVSLKDTRAPSMTKLKPWDLTRKEPKFIVLWEILQMLGTIMVYPLYLMVRKMLKAVH